MNKSGAKKNDNTNVGKIIETAVDVFAKYGYQRTTIRKISRQAGVSLGLINYHWRSKQELWNEVCKVCAEQIISLMFEGANFDAPPEESIPNFISRLFDRLVENRKLLRIFAWFTLEAETFDYPQTRDILEPMLNFGSVYLQNNQQKSLVPNVDIRVALMMIRALFVYIFIDSQGHIRAYGKDFSDPEHAARIKKNFMRVCPLILGLKAPEDEATGGRQEAVGAGLKPAR